MFRVYLLHPSCFACNLMQSVLHVVLLPRVSVLLEAVLVSAIHKLAALFQYEWWCVSLLALLSKKVVQGHLTEQQSRGD